MTENEGAAAISIPTTPAPTSGSTAEIPTNPGSVAVAERPFMEALPAEFREKPWAQDIAKNEKPWDAMFKTHDNLQKKIGERVEGVVIPGEGAAPEVVAAYNKAIGVPETPAGYEYKTPDISKEPEAVQKVLTERLGDTTFIDTMRTKAHEAGITPKQFATLAAAFDAKQIEQVKASIEGQSTVAKTYQDTEAKIFKDLYGDKGDDVKATSKDIIAKVVPQSIRESKNANLALVALAMYINEKVFKNDTIGGANMGAPQMSKDAVREQILKLRQDPAYKDPFARNHKEINAKVDALYNQMYESPPKE